MGKVYYWLTGTFEILEQANDTDEKALEENYVSVVPVTFDLTAHQFINQLKKWKWE